MKIYLITGKSGCGKSFLVKKIMAGLGITERDRRTWRQYTYYNKGNFYIYGKFNIQQAGIDSQPKKYKEFINHIGKINPSAVILFEGLWYDHEIEYTKKWWLDVTTDKVIEQRRQRRGEFILTEKQLKRWNSIDNSKDKRTSTILPYETDKEREIVYKFLYKLFEKYSLQEREEKRNMLF